MASFFSPQSRIHIVGIKGAGVSALAKILLARGMSICGSDVEEHFFTDQELALEGVTVESFSENHIAHDPIDAVIYSTAWKDAQEVTIARERGLPTISYPEALGHMMDERYGIAVSGSHGKTTTSALLTHILLSSGIDIAAVIGSTMLQYHTNALAGTSQIMVIEADEYENKFIYYHPKALLVTTIDYDHPDFFASPEVYDDAFRMFAQKVLASGGIVVACADDPGCRRVFRSDGRIVWYGTDPSSHYRIDGISVRGRGVQYSLVKNGVRQGTYHLALPGTHNVQNAVGAIALADILGLVDVTYGATRAQDFIGTARRFEYRGSRGDCRVYDDFAHHPTEIMATLQGARELFPEKRIWCVFGAHTYTRTQTLLPQFAKSFQRCSRALILDIYGSAREAQGTIHGSDLAAAINAESHNATYVGTHESALRMITDHIDEIDVLITMGAGDVWKIGESLINNPAYEN